jgi:hypothetical protein
MGWPPQTFPRPSSSLHPAGFDSRLRGGIGVPTGDEFPIVNFELVGTATLSRPCLGLGGR